MISLEQVKLLESKVTRTIEYVRKVTEENTQLKGKLDSYQTKIDELEVLIQRFKDDQNRIEDGILSALDRLNQFEDALESTLSSEGKQPSGAKAGPKNNAREEKKPPEPAAEVRQGRGSPPEPAPPAEEKNPEPSRGELDIF